MRVDLYTKSILTVIAVCLTAIVVRDVPTLPEAHAVSVSDRGKDVVRVQIVSIDESPPLRWDALPVEVAQ